MIITTIQSYEGIGDFRKAFKKVSKRGLKKTHYEISFDNRKDFDRFARNIFVLSNILNFKPKSVYELAKLLDTDVSNLNKIILFFEDIGALQLKKQQIDGRQVNTPTVPYDSIKIDLKAS